jgi:hypothetical protein
LWGGLGQQQEYVSNEETSDIRARVILQRRCKRAPIRHISGGEVKQGYESESLLGGREMREHKGDEQVQGDMKVTSKGRRPVHTIWGGLKEEEV